MAADAPMNWSRVSSPRTRQSPRGSQSPVAAGAAVLRVTVPSAVCASRTGTSPGTPAPDLLGRLWPSPASQRSPQGMPIPQKGSATAEESRWDGWEELRFWDKHGVLLLLLPYALVFTLIQAVCTPRQVDRLTDAFGGSEAHAAVIQSYWDAAGQTVAFVIAPTLGRLSDAYGRKWFLVSCAVWYSLPPLALAVSTDVYAWLPVRAVSFVGMGGFLGAVFLLPAIADLYPPKHRGLAIALMIAALATGVCFAPLSLLPVSDSAAFGACAGLGFCTAAYLASPLVPETLAPDLRRPFRLCPGRAPGAGPSGGDRQCAVLGLAYVAFAATLSEMGLSDIQSYYFKDQLDFTDADISDMILEQGVLNAFGQSVFFVLMKRLLRSDARVLVAGIIGTVVFFLFAAMVTTKWELYAVVLPIQMVSLLVFPTVASISSSLFTSVEQGEGLGLLAGARGLAYAVGPIMFAELFAQLKDQGAAGAPFLVAAILNLVAAMMAVCCVLPRLARAGNPLLLDEDTDSEAPSGSGGLLGPTASSPASPTVASPAESTRGLGWGL
eukprot:TRINITY_DN11779_c0_g1_i1.p1 TRINITY_DN11779_c0_g1~~TRINITY_DN11779_c0_g1_i1.p1  ORF type:complete len:575 (+),score=121.67 TRINITY_DN11779_c0_g1_i1:72-1727(+)